MITNTATRTKSNLQTAPWSVAGTLDDYCGEVLQRLGWPDREGKHPLRTLGITSSRNGEGVSTLAAHLATAAAARHSGRVILVDANINRPMAARIFGVSNSPGLCESVTGGDSPIDLLQSSALPNLHVLSAGKLRGSSAQVFGSADIVDVVHELSVYSDLVVFDLPPASQASCASRLTAALDGVLLVVEAETVGWEAAARVKELLTHAGVRIVGAVLNKCREGS